MLEAITKINELFDKYEIFIDAIIKYHKKKGTKFILGSFRDGYSSAESNIFGIRLNLTFYSLPTDDYIKDLIRIKKDGLSCNCDDDKIMTYDVCHEIGHVILSANMLMDKDNRLAYCEIVKNIISSTAFIQYSYFGQITEYGQIANSKEWFAEVFAHLQCTKKPNGLGLAMRDFLEARKSR